jgi:hypothetical protein
MSMQKLSMQKSVHSSWQSCSVEVSWSLTAAAMWCVASFAAAQR